MKYKQKVRIAKKVIGWALYNDFSIKDSIESLLIRKDLNKKEGEWADKHSEKMAYMDCEFDEEFYYFGEDK